MKRFFLLCLALIATISQSFAQENSNFWSIKAGVNFANFTNLDYTSKYQSGFNVGVTRAFALSPQIPIYIQSGLSFEMKGAKNSIGFDKQTFKSYALEIPVLLNYGMRISKNSAIHPFVGLYYSIALGGSMDIGDESINPYKKEELLVDEMGEITRSRMFSRSDFGIRAGVDYKYMKYTIGIAYDAGLLNIYAKDLRDLNYKASSGAISLNLGYCF